ncbi:MAG: lipase family protein [Nitrosomonas sp.]|nr:lipase family protein [Nitrosomonas sp.]
MAKNRLAACFTAFIMMQLLAGCSIHQSAIAGDGHYTADTIDFNEVKWYAQRASAAYNSAKQIKAAFPDTVRVVQVRDSKVQYFLESDPNAGLQIISIRGTDNLKNVREDVEYIKSKNNKLDIYVHSGFDEATYKIYNDIVPFLKKEYKIRLTGHSLGAAISTLLMMYLHEDGFEVERSINFGQPKVTNKDGAARYGFLPLTRVVNENDAVPLVPPVTLLSALHGVYRHMGDEIILLKGERYVYLKQHQASKKLIEGFWENIDHESITEHFIANYLININSKLGKSIRVPYAQRELYLDQHAD